MRLKKIKIKKSKNHNCDKKAEQNIEIYRRRLDSERIVSKFNSLEKRKFKIRRAVFIKLEKDESG